MTSYFDINEGFTKYIERMKEAQKTAATVDVNLINDATLLRMGIEAMYQCGLFEKALDEWEDRSNLDQSWEDFINHFQEAEERFNLKKNIHDKKGGIGRANAAVETEEQVCEYQDYDASNMSTYLDNLAAAATQEKDVLDRLVSNNEKLVEQLERLTTKFDQLSSNNNGNTNNSTTPTLNGKSLQFKKYDPEGYCHTCGYKNLFGHNSKTCKSPRDGHKKEATRRDTKNGSTKQKNWKCSFYEEHGFWVSREK